MSGQRFALDRPAKKVKTKRPPPPIQYVTGEPQHIGGLDASTKRIGYAAPNGTTHSIIAAKLPAHPRPMDLAVRCHQLRAGLSRAIRLNPPIPQLMVYEGAFFMHAGASARLDELRGVLRDELIVLGIPFVEVNVDHVKMMAAGKKDADKALMRHAAMCTIAHYGIRLSRQQMLGEPPPRWWDRPAQSRIPSSITSTLVPT